MKMRTKNFKTGEIFYPHTLNGSSVAVGRILISLLENFQQSNGSVMIPKTKKLYERFKNYWRLEKKNLVN